MDCKMGAMDGIETTRQLMRTMPYIKMIGLSTGFDDDGTEAAMLARLKQCPASLGELPAKR